MELPDEKMKMKLAQEGEGGEWMTAGKQKSRKAITGRPAARERLEAGQLRRNLKEVLPKKGGAKRTQAKHQGRNVVDANSGSAGDGRTVYEQLRKYLRNEAPNEYVEQTVIRLKDLAAERRFQAYLRLLPAHVRKENEVGVLRREWTDAVPFRLRERHDSLTSDWELGDADHQLQLAKLMYRWIIRDNEAQREVEERLRFISLIPKLDEQSGEERNATGSYLAAVQHDGPREAVQLTAEQERLRGLCMENVLPTSKLRLRTSDESAAILMILNHEIEVPAVPAFLAQSMAPEQLAIFEDLFKALEYSIYAHIAPGQRFFSNMAPAAILTQIHPGTEAAPAHKSRIEEFQRDLSRITLDMRARILKVTFKGRAAAVKWVGWQLPLASKLLTLVDYDMIRERAKRTNELVMMDYYSFIVEVRKGTMTSREMFKLLKEGLGLSVQAMSHIASPTTGIHELQWKVRIHATECPSSIEDKGYIARGEVEVVIHHVGTFVNWPCRKCLSPAHPTRVCAISEEQIEVERNKHTCALQVAVQTGSGNTRTGKEADGNERAMAKLERILRGEGARGVPATTRPNVANNVRSEEEDNAEAPVPEREPQKKVSDEVDERSAERREGEIGPLPGKVEEACGETEGEAQPEEGVNAETEHKEVEGTEELAAEGALIDTAEPLSTNVSRGDDKAPGMQQGASTGGTVLPLTEGTDATGEGSVEDGDRPHANAGGERDQTAADKEVDFEVEGGEDDYEMEHSSERTPLQDEYKEAIRATKDRTSRMQQHGQETVRGRSPNARMQRTRSPTRGVSTRITQMVGVESSDHEVKRPRRKGKYRIDSRRVSSSPKRKAGRHWVQGRAVDPALDGNDGIFGAIEDVRASSLSPKRLSLEKVGKSPDQKLQKFIHEFMFAVTGRAEKEGGRGEKTYEEGDEPAFIAEQTTPFETKEKHERTQDIAEGMEVSDEDPGFALVAISSPTDTGKPLQEWLELLKGEVADCGWLAFFAALYNETEGLEQPTTGVVAQANMLKKRVINEMLANLVDEASLHPDDLRAEATALGCDAAATPVERLCAIGNHLADQRTRSVKAHVPMHYWVRPMHLKAMATHARETLYVLDVNENGRARIQAYAYHDIKNSAGELVETGTVCPIQTPLAVSMLEELVEAGIRPPVLILRWSPLGNHFQAVHYKTEDYEHYATNIVRPAAIRNRILVKHGWKTLDAIGYDVDKTAKAAAGVLTALRKKPMGANETVAETTRYTDVQRPSRTIAMEVAELQALEHSRQLQRETDAVLECNSIGKTQVKEATRTEADEPTKPVGDIAPTKAGQIPATSQPGREQRTQLGEEGASSVTTTRPTEGGDAATST